MSYLPFPKAFSHLLFLSLPLLSYVSYILDFYSLSSSAEDLIKSFRLCTLSFSNAIPVISPLVSGHLRLHLAMPSSAEPVHELDSTAVSEGKISDTESGQHHTHDSQVGVKDIKDPNLVDWDGPDDPENPMNWPRSSRMLHVVLVSMFTLYAYDMKSNFALFFNFLAN